MHPWFLRGSLARLLCSICLLLCLLVPVIGCSSKAKPPEVTEVSGKVLFQGKPLPGGRVIFVTVQGAWSGSGVIDENGNYKFNAPVGEVKIGVSNDMLAPTRKPFTKNPVLKRPGTEPIEQKGHYVAIPDRYTSPEESGLTYRVEKGAPPHEIRLE
jgi:hypothetical protein